MRNLVWILIHIHLYFCTYPLCGRTADIFYLKSPVLSDMPRAQSSTVSGSAQEKLADKTADVREMYERKIKALRAELLKIEDAINTLPPLERLVMRLREALINSLVLHKLPIFPAAVSKNLEIAPLFTSIFLLAARKIFIFMQSL